MNYVERVAVITGANGGIGAAVLAELRKRGFITASLNRHTKVGNLSDEEMEIATDVGNEQAVIHARECIIKNWGRVDVLVNCAAAPPAVSPSADLGFSEWRNVMSTDLDGTFLCCKVFGKEMLNNNYGRIVNMASFHTIATYPERVAYNAAKSGVVGITRALAVEWGRYGITVNSVSPGPVKTPRTSFFLNKDPESEHGMMARTPNAMLAEPHDVATLIAFLCSEEARHINGQNIVIDGGWSKSAWWGDYTAGEK